MEKLDSILFYNLDKAIRTYRTYAQREIKANGFNITIDQWLIIKAILENPDIKQNELGNLVFKDNASVTRIIDLLVKANYLKRSINAKDRRSTILEITDLGKQTIAEVQKVVDKNRAKALKGIKQEDIENMNALLLQISDNCLKSKK